MGQNLLTMGYGYVKDPMSLWKKRSGEANCRGLSRGTGARRAAAYISELRAAAG